MSGLRNPGRRVSLCELEAAIAQHGSFDAAVAALDAPAEAENNDPPPTPALDAWYEDRFHKGGSDRPRTHLWFPKEAPYTVLQTATRAADMQDYLLDPDKPLCDVHLGGGVQVGGYLSEMEAYFTAVIESLRVARWQADAIARRMAEEAESEVAS